MQTARWPDYSVSTLLLSALLVMEMCSLGCQQLSPITNFYLQKHYRVIKVYGGLK